MDLVIATAAQGVLWGLYALGVYLTYRVLDIADLTVEGSFPLGAAVAASMLVAGYTPLTAILAACAAGCVSGIVTGFFCTKLKIPALLAGILTMIGLYSINLRVMGKANLPLLQQETLFTEWNIWGLDAATNILLIGTVVVVLAILLTYWFFGTELGSALRATGNNEDMIRALGFNVNKGKLIALMVSNGLVGLSGGLVAQSQKYADINMGTGAIVIGLAAIVIGEVLLSKYINFAVKLTAAVFGTVVYFWIRAVVLRLGLDANYMRVVSAIIVFIALAVPVILERVRIRKSYRADV